MDIVGYGYMGLSSDDLGCTKNWRPCKNRISKMARGLANNLNDGPTWTRCINKIEAITNQKLDSSCFHPYSLDMNAWVCLKFLKRSAFLHNMLYIKRL